MADHVERRLVVLRHAKSDWPPVPDAERPLSARGMRDAPAVGAALRSAGVAPDLVICSTARRTQQTWQRAAAALGVDAPVREEERAYAATAPELLALVRELPEAVETAVLVGHNPGVQDLVHGLTGADVVFKTSAYAVLAVEGPWERLAPGAPTLIAFETPRG